MKVARGAPRPQPGTLTQLFFEAVDKYDKPNALQVKIGGRYEPISHRELATRVRHTGRGLQSLGLAPGDRVAILSENRPEWAIADYACLTSALVDVTIYPTLTAAQVAYIVRDAGAAAIFVSNRIQAEKIAEQRAELPALKTVISFEDVGPLADLTLQSLEHKGAQNETSASIDAYRTTALSVKPDDVATLIYTSGTTGEPKGVMLTHDNIYSNVQGAIEAIDFKDDVGLSFLPLSHIFERMAGHYLMFTTGSSIAYAESIDTVPDNILEVRPTLMISVPRLYEKMYARVLENAAAGGAIKLRIFNWARHVGEQWTDKHMAKQEPNGLLALKYKLAHKLVFSKLKARTGGRLRYFVSGGAPLSPEINKFFYGAGLTILEGYGLTETSPVIAVNVPGAIRMGTVGQPYMGVEVMIADDGEILTRGPHVMKGYFNKPGATVDAIDADGWFQTGDIGELDADNFLRITDRKKDIIVTAGGKNIAPQPIENRVTQNKYVSQAVMIGDRRKFPSILVVPDFTQLEKWATYKHVSFTDHASLIARPEVQAKMEREVLAPLADMAHYEIPKKVVLLEHEFTLEHGELTPTLKVKRRVVDELYKAQIDKIYAE